MSDQTTALSSTASAYKLHISTIITAIDITTHGMLAAAALLTLDRGPFVTPGSARPGTELFNLEFMFLYARCGARCFVPARIATNRSLG